MISPDTILVQESGLLGTSTATQRVVLNEKFEYLGLDPIAEHIFELLETPTSFDNLVGILTQEFAISPERCRADITPFLEKMVEHRLLRTT
ncbi:MAG: PqqD family protein [Nocardioides sp.]|jgi:hypothetical protein